MAKVFILNKTVHNYNPASRYGELISVTEGNIPIFKTDTVLDILSTKLNDFTENDYLLVSGPTIINMLAILLLYEKFNTIKLLLFDAKQQDYIVRHINKGSIKNICELISHK